MTFLPARGTFIIYDTEFTSWPGFREQGFEAPGKYPEIIQIGAVCLDIERDCTEVGHFECLVRPTVNPHLSPYITDLTGISQCDVDDKGLSFTDALAGFLAFIENSSSSQLISYGRDGWVMGINCRLNESPIPNVFMSEINLRDVFVARGICPASVISSELPDYLGFSPTENAHDALADARAVADALRHLLAENRL